jgi:hypothetical protein
MRDVRLVLSGVLWCSAVACGPDQRPPESCDGPSYDLIVRAGDMPLPPDTRINVRYGSNQQGEPYALGEPSRKQAVFCKEDTAQGGGSSESEDDGPSAGQGGAGSASPDDAGADGRDVWALRCQLYTQGPARVDVTATGYEQIKDRILPFDGEDRCDVEANIELTPLAPELDE